MSPLLSLPDGQLRCLVAHAASWLVLRRAPTQPEMRRAGVSSNTGAVTSLVVLGLLTADWDQGKRDPRSVRPTLRAWRLLSEFETEVEAA